MTNPARTALAALTFTCLVACGGSSSAPPPPAITAFAAASAALTEGQGTTLTATFTGGSGAIDQGVGSVQSGQQIQVTPAATTTYRLTVTSPSGATATRDLEVAVHPPPAITGFSASPATVPFGGGPVTLSATYSGGTAQVTPGVGPLASGGTAQAALTGPGRFTLTVTSPAGATATTTLDVPEVGGATLALARFGHAATRLADGRVLLSGGRHQAPVSGTTTTELYDPATGRVTAGPDLPEPRAYMVDVLLPGGQVLLAGGDRDGAVVASSVLVDVAGASVTAGPSLPQAKNSFGFAALGSRLVVAGGYDGAAGALSSAEVLDLSAAPATLAFAPAGTLTVPRMYNPAVAPLPDGRFLAAGGFNYGSDALASAEVLDLAAAGGPAWTATGSMSVARTGVALAVLPGGEVLAIGGAAGGVAHDLVERFDPASGSFLPAGHLMTGRAYPFVAVLSDGRVLVAGGGTGAFEPLATTELFDPVTGGSAPGPDLSEARLQGSATVLQDGSVLLVGGSSAGSVASAAIDRLRFGP